MRKVIPAVALFAILSPLGSAQPPKPDRATQEKLAQAEADLTAAQKAEDVAAVTKAAARAAELLGDQAGVPEAPDEFRRVPKDAKPLTADELPGAFDRYFEQLPKVKWWSIGLDPTKTNHAPREVATVIEGLLAARAVAPKRADEYLKAAAEAGDFLVWAQEQAGTGVIPFPALRNGTGRPFEVAERFYRDAEKRGKLDEVIKKGWAVDDFDDGGLQFDNGVAGVALVKLFEATQEAKYKKAAVRAADWAAGRRVVPNWNYNSFSVMLLADVYRLTGDDKYRAAAVRKTKLGVLPGQLTAGDRKGRWADAHNARPAYHYILLRALAALAAALPKDDPELPAVVSGLRLGLLARNPDFRKGVVNVDSSVEALVRVRTLPAHVAGELGGCETDDAFDTLERYAASGFRAGKAPLGPGAWGLLLADVKRRAK